MDLLFKRYASPFSLLDEYIASCRMCEFIDKLLEIRNQENEDNTLWEFYLHKVFDKSYSQFISEAKNEPLHNGAIDFETTIQDSCNLLSNFVPV